MPATACLRGSLTDIADFVGRQYRYIDAWDHITRGTMQQDVVAKWVSDLGRPIRIEPRNLHDQGRMSQVHQVLECSTAGKPPSVRHATTAANCSQKGLIC